MCAKFSSGLVRDVMSLMQDAGRKRECEVCQRKMWD